MEKLVGFVVFALIVAVLWGLGRLKDKAIDASVGAVNRRVQSGKHADGVQLAESIFFYGVGASEATDAEIIASLRSGVLAAPGKAASDSPPVIGVPTTHVRQVEESRIAWAHGTSIATSFTAAATVVTVNWESGDSERGVALSFPDVSERDGIVADITSMRALKTDVLTALRTIDPNVVEKVID